MSVTTSSSSLYSPSTPSFSSTADPYAGGSAASPGSASADPSDPDPSPPAASSDPVPSFPPGSSSTDGVDTNSRPASHVTGAENAPRTPAGSDASVAGAFSSVLQARVGAIDFANSPTNVMDAPELRFDRLPTSGQAAREPWSGSYWPTFQGGISYRWKTDESHTYNSPGRDALASMSRAEIDKLSPSEKYDILVGSYSYPLTEGVKSANRPETPTWQGYCHGWTQASIHFSEPRPTLMTNPDGIEVPFSSADIKALLTYFQGQVMTSSYSSYPFSAETRTVGTLTGLSARSSGSYDVNPGSFHAMLGNLLGKESRAFGIDCDNGREKWNQPLHAYSSSVVGRRSPDPRASPEAVEEIIVKTDVTYTLENHPSDQPNGITGQQINKTETYLYSVELNDKGEIVGGQWMLDVDGQLLTYHDVLEIYEGRGMSDREISTAMPQIFNFPDYAFVQEAGEFADAFVPASGIYDFLTQDKRKLHGYLAKLKDLYEAATV